MFFSRIILFEEIVFTKHFSFVSSLADAKIR